MSRFVRSSKFRHVFGTPAKPENCYAGTKLTLNAWDSNFCSVNSKYLSVIWQSGGGGVFSVLNVENTGRIGEVPLVSGHKGAVLDISWNPMNENLIASASEDCNVMIWGIPEGGLKENMTTPLQTLSGHKRKVGTVNFHPSAENILATSSTDYTVKIWDIEKGEDLFSIGGHTDIVQSTSWNKDGSLICSACRDKKLRVIDPRSQSVVGEVPSHQGVKGTRCCWLTDKDKIFTTGFTKMSEREFNVWDPRSLDKPIAHQNVDTMSGVLMPFYDVESSMLFLAGKGDGNIRYYEIVDDKPFFYFLSEYKSSVPQKGMAMLPKRNLNVSACEIVKLYKVEKDKVEPISFAVPRKSDIFQDDLYPDCFSGVPSLTAEQWKNGENKDPDNSFSHAPGFVAPERAAEFKPVVKEVETGPKTEKELRDEYEKLLNRVSYLEAELAKKDTKIKELESK